MKKRAVQIPGDYYFSPETVSIAVKKVQGNSVTHPHDYTALPHWHSFMELVIITAGNGVQNINGISYNVSAGDVFVIAGETIHFFEKYSSLEIVNIMFSEKILDPFREYLKRMPGFHMIFCFEPELRTGREFGNSLHLNQPDLAHVKQAIRKMESEQEQKNPGFETEIISGLLDLSVFLSRQFNQPQAPVSRLAGLLGELENSCAAGWDLQKMAHFCCMSKNTLLRTFQQVLKQSPLQYLISLRLNMACKYLSSGDMPIHEIANICGFADSNYFSKCFRRHFRLTPGNFRRKEKNKNDKKLL